MTTSPKPTKDEALKLALDALENAITYGSLTGAEWVFEAVDKAISAIREALAQPAADDKAGGEVWSPTEAQYIEWCERHGMQPADREAFFDAASLYLSHTRPQPQAEETIEQMAERLASKGWQAVVCGACGSEMAVGYPKPQAAQPAEPSGIDAGENPPNKTLYLMMARHGLNMVVGEDMGRLLAFGRDVWRGAQSERPADRVALTDEQIATFAEATAQAILFDLQGRRGIMDGVDEQVQQEIVSEHTAIIRSQLSGHGITAKDQP